MREAVESEGGLRFLEKILRYVSNTADSITRDELKNLVKESFSHEKGGLVMTIAEKMRKEGYRQGILEAIEMGLSIKFGDESLKMMSLIRRIRKSEKLDAIKNTVRHAKDLSELRAILES
ncbi:MAG TPA: hypothetical protein DCQ37_02160 [Desulfobacteraceae bacterium]|nr:hypothetical protein [Desulfobacteraceae bacterium]